MPDRRLQFDIVIVGAGPAGLAAACAASECGRKAALLESAPWIGGQIWRGEEAHFANTQARYWINRVRKSGATLLTGTNVIAANTPITLLAEQPHGAVEIQWRKLILATGARELFLPFPGWTLPGVFGPGGLQGLVKNGWPVAGKKVVIAGTGPLLLAAADGLKKHGARVVLIAEQTRKSHVAELGLTLLAYPGKVLQGAALKARLLGVPQRYGVWPVRALGSDHVRVVELTNGRDTWTENCDQLACGFHLVPNVELPITFGCDLRNGFVKVDHWQMTSVADVFCAGEPTAIGGVNAALVEGQIAGYAASGQLEKAERLFSQRATHQTFAQALDKTYALRDELKGITTDDTIFCRCEDVTFARVKQHRFGREAKLQTRCGMGICQGRICGAAAKIILGWEQSSVRPPVHPARINSLTTHNQAH